MGELNRWERVILAISILALAAALILADPRGTAAALMGLGAALSLTGGTLILAGIRRRRESETGRNVELLMAGTTMAAASAIYLDIPSEILLKFVLAGALIALIMSLVGARSGRETGRRDGPADDHRDDQRENQRDNRTD